jgi:hypothetical protein
VAKVEEVVWCGIGGGGRRCRKHGVIDLWDRERERERVRERDRPVGDTR